MLALVRNDATNPGTLARQPSLAGVICCARQARLIVATVLDATQPLEEIDCVNEGTHGYTATNLAASEQSIVLI